MQRNRACAITGIPQQQNRLAPGYANLTNKSHIKVEFSFTLVVKSDFSSDNDPSKPFFTGRRTRSTSFVQMAARGLKRSTKWPEGRKKIFRRHRWKRTGCRSEVLFTEKRGRGLHRPAGRMVQTDGRSECAECCLRTSPERDSKGKVTFRTGSSRNNHEKRSGVVTAPFFIICSASHLRPPRGLRSQTVGISGQMLCVCCPDRQLRQGPREHPDAPKPYSRTTTERSRKREPPYGFPTTKDRP